MSKGGEKERKRGTCRKGKGRRKEMINLVNDTYPSSVDENISTVGINGESFLKASLALLRLKVSSKYPTPLEQCIDVHL